MQEEEKVPCFIKEETQLQPMVPLQNINEKKFKFKCLVANDDQM